jgi:hypothetical protein
VSNLQVLLDDEQIGPILVSCASPIFLNAEQVLSDGAEFSFEVLEKDAAMLLSRLNKQEHYSIGGGPLFLGELRSLRPCESTHPALAFMRFEPTLRGLVKVHKMVDLGASPSQRN